MKLSMMSYTLARRREEFTIKGMFELARELDLPGVDMVTLYDTAPEEVRSMSDDYGVPVICYTFFVQLNTDDESERRAGLDAVKRGVEAAVILGAPVLMLPTPGKEGVDRGTSRRNWIKGLQQAVPIAADAGLALTVENFPGAASPFVIAADLMEAVREAPGFKVTYDNGNAATGEEPVQSFLDVAEHTVHAHFKDWTIVPDGEGKQMLDGRFYSAALIGEGIVDHRACLAAMQKAGYDGYINIEYEGNTYTPAEGTRKAVAYLRGLASEIGWGDHS